MPSPKSKVVIASAGSRKTTYLVEEAISDPDSRIAIVTYTIDNLRQIEQMFHQIISLVVYHSLPLE